MISEAYRQEQEKLHENPNYGRASLAYAPVVSRLINNLNVKDVLDYGAGKGRLSESIIVDHRVSVTNYDPAVEKWSDAPKPHEFVACIDVLEHVEPEYLDSVLDDLKRVTEKYAILSVHTGKAMKTLSDGRNAHLTIKPLEWWLPKIMERFSLESLLKSKFGFYVVVKNVNI